MDAFLNWLKPEQAAKIFGWVLFGLTAAEAFATVYHEKIKSSRSRKILFAIILFTPVIAFLSLESNSLKDKVSDKEKRISEERIKFLEAETAMAKRETETIKNTSITIRTQLETASAASAIEQQKLAKMQIDVADSRRKQAEAEKSLEDLRTRLRARSIDAGQREILVRSLRPLAGSRIKVEKLGDKEASEYADQIISAIRESGITVDVSFTGTLSPPRYGVIVSPSPPSNAISTFLFALKNSQIDFKVETLPTQGGQFGIFIGLKPPADT